MPADTIAPAHPAATVILLRDGPGGMETLLLRRNANLAFHGGSWVFPGGRVDPEDYPLHAPREVEAAASRAAVREAREEAGVVVDEADLVSFSHWTTPVGLPKRFSTWFFLAPTRAAAVEVDGQEIHDHRWLRPPEALAARAGGELELPPPTFVSLLKLARFERTADALTALSGAAPETFAPRNQTVPGGRLSLYEGDAGYESEDYDLAGPRHRLWMMHSGWRYERDGG